MLFTASERIAAPRDFVFERACEFDRLVRAIEGRGGVVERVAEAPGAPRYDVQYPFRDQLWPASLELRGLDEPEAMEIGVEAKVVEALARFDFRAPEPEWTMAELSVTLKPRGMQGRLLIGSLHAVRGRVQERLDGDLAALARKAERMWRDAGGR